MQRKLTDIQLRNAKTKPDGKVSKLSDGGGLFLQVSTTGKYWRYNYRFAGKQRTLSLGIYPDISLSQARESHNAAREQLAEGFDPSEKKKAAKQVEIAKHRDSFEIIARGWFASHSVNWSDSHKKRVLARLENDVFPWLGSVPITQIEPPDVLRCLKRIESRGALETAHRIKQSIGQVFRYAVANGKAERDQTADLKGALPPVKQKHFAAIIEPKLIGELLRGCWAYKGDYSVQAALKLSAYLFTRPGEIRRMEWQEIDFQERRWIIPAEKMKTRAAHIVPLPEQAIAVLKDLQPLTGNYAFVFPGVRSKSRPMSDNTVRQAIRRLGYDNTQMTAHGFRAMASTTLYELGYSSDLIERQLAHVVGNDVRRAYDRSENLPERKNMIQHYADHLDALRNGADVIPINRNQA